MCSSINEMQFLEKLGTMTMERWLELGKLKQLRDLMITNFKGELGYTLCSSINEMQFLEKLHINAIGYNEVIDLNFKSTQSALRKLCLRGKLKKLPNWIPRLENLVNLSLMYSELTNDPLESVKDMPNLLFLTIKFVVCICGCGAVVVWWSLTSHWPSKVLLELKWKFGLYMLRFGELVL